MNNYYQTKRKIENFRNIEPGWHYGEGTIPAESAINSSLRLLKAADLAMFPQTDASPGIDGEIQFNIYYGLLYLEFTIENDGGITFVYERDGRIEVYEDALTIDDSIVKILKIGERRWDLLDLSISDTTTLILDVLRVSPLSPRRTEAEYQSSRLIASQESPAVYADTYSDTTRNMGRHLQYSGQSPKIDSQKVADSSPP